MLAEAAHSGFAIHASAVTIGGRALLIRGPSKSGKSRLALALIAASASRRPIELLGDDRIFLSREGAGFSARPHPRIAGFIERRGLGIVALPFRAVAPVGGIVVLGSTTPCEPDMENLPRLPIVTCPQIESQRDSVLCWWDARIAACEPHLAGKGVSPPAPVSKD